MLRRVQNTAVQDAAMSQTPPLISTRNYDDEGQKLHDELRYEVAWRMPDRSQFSTPPENLRRFADLQYVHSTFLSTEAPIGGDRRINANMVSPHTLAMMAPLDQRPQYMVALAGTLLDRKVGLIIDLTSPQDQQQRRLKYRDGGHYEAECGAIASFKTTQESRAPTIAADAVERNLMVELTLPDGSSHGKKTIAYLNCPVPDYEGTQPETLHNLSRHMCDWRMLHPDEDVAIHCTAGVGRTGLVVACERVMNVNDHGLLTAGNRDATVRSEVLELRSQRSDVMVQSPKQFAALLAFTDLLLKPGRRRVPDTDEPPNYPAIGRAVPRPPTYVNVNPQDFRHSVFQEEEHEEMPAHRPLQRSAPLRSAVRVDSTRTAPAEASPAPDGNPLLRPRATVYENVGPDGKALAQPYRGTVWQNALPDGSPLP